MDREPTFNESMEELQLACGRLMIDVLQEAVRLAILPLRFIMWLNGCE